MCFNLFCRRWNKPNTDQVFTKRNAEKELYNAFEKDIAVANFYFESTTCIEFIRDVTTTYTDFFSNVGGILGLCMGISCISGIELIYWFAVRMFSNSCTI